MQAVRDGLQKKGFQTISILMPHWLGEDFARLIPVVN